MSKIQNRWLYNFQPRPQARLRLFCLPYAGGAASIYRTWAQGLPSDIEVCAIQLPGRENRLGEPPYGQMKPLVQALTVALLPALDRPFMLFGHSMGALIAYELAHYLHQHHGLPPAKLFVSGRRAPHLPDPHSHLHNLADDDLLVAIQRRYGGIPDLLFQDAELKAIFASLLRADFTLVENYCPSTTAPLPCSIYVFGGDRDPYAPQAELLAWRDLTQRDFALQLLPGGHFYLNEQRALLLASVAEALERVP